MYFILTMPKTTAQEKADANHMAWALLTFLSVDATSYDDADVVIALKHAGVRGFNSNFLGLSVLDIDDLHVPANLTKGTPEKALGISDSFIRKLKKMARMTL